MNANRRMAILRVLILIAVIALTIFIFAIRDQVEVLAEYGYAGIFLVSVLANATLILPAPGVAIVFAMGAVFNPFWVALSAAAGSAIGELSGYLAGFSGRAVIENGALYERITNWMKIHPAIAYFVIFILAAIPNPLFDLAGIAAGALRISLPGFMFYCFLGKIVKMLIFAYAGFYSIDFFESLT